MVSSIPQEIGFLCAFHKLPPTNGIHSLLGIERHQGITNLLHFIQCCQLYITFAIFKNLFTFSFTYYIFQFLNLLMKQGHDLWPCDIHVFVKKDSIFGPKVIRVGNTVNLFITIFLLNLASPFQLSSWRSRLYYVAYSRSRSLD